VTSTEWLARRSGNRILCGRMVGGRHACQGEISELMLGSGGVRRPILRGFVQREDGLWEESRTAREKVATGRRASFKARPLNAAGEKVRPIQVPKIPWRRLCPVCRCTALVESVVLI